jgi:hypothetical protein
MKCLCILVECKYSKGLSIILAECKVKLEVGVKTRDWSRSGDGSQIRYANQF